MYAELSKRKILTFNKFFLFSISMHTSYYTSGMHI